MTSKVITKKNGLIMLLILTILGLGYMKVNDTEELVISEDIEVQENIPPIVDAGEDFSVLVGERFSFDGSASDTDGKVVLYEWDVNDDGKYETRCNMCAKDSHSYDEPGTYIARLKVTDDNGAISTETITITVTQ